MDRSELVCASSGVVSPYVASAPIAALPRDRDAQVLCVPVLLRPGGFLLALPTGSVPPSLLAAGAEADATGMHGPSTTLEVAAVEEDEDASERPVSDSLSVLVVDLSDDALQYLAPYDSEAGLAVVSFDPVHPDRFPSAEDLLVLARSWLRSAAHDRAACYTAAEEEREPEGAPSGGALPGEAKGDGPVGAACFPTGSSASRACSSAALPGSQAKGGPRHALLSGECVWPAVKGEASSHGPPSSGAFGGRRTGQAPGRFGAGQAEGEVSAALAQQSNALAVLVTHLISQASEASADFGGGASGSALSSKGSARREKLQAELANYTGAFMVSVAQAGARRMNPTAPPPRSLDELRSSPAQVTDHLLSGEVDGTLDLLSLMRVAMEQAGQDHGKWEVAS